jgi:hypothetical protein
MCLRMPGKEKAYRDYGVFEKIRGPGGNTIVVISGTRDAGHADRLSIYVCAEA